MRRKAPILAAAKSALRGQTTNVRSIPAPIGGWNARDPLAEMKPTDAVGLVNWVARVADCAVRGGCADHVTGFAAQPKTLALYTPPTASNKMFAATDAGYFDATSAGAVGANVAALTNGYCNWTQMGVSGGHFLLSFNGVNKPWYYNGTTWVAIDGASTPAITGVTTSLLISANVYKRRLFFVEINKLAFRYLTAADAIGGAAAEFLLGPLCQKGGYLMAMGTWSFDGGTGSDDYAVFITSQGEAIVFTGTDPGNASLWALVGVYQIGAKPLGRKCLVKYGGDLVLLTEFGALPLSKVLQSTAVDYKQALSNKIEKAFTQAAVTTGAIAGWEAQIYPAENALIVNVPITAGAKYEQYLMNTITKSWYRFTDWNASAFAVFNRELYYADTTKVAKAWTGRADYGANIVADAQTAYNYFRDPKVSKNWKLLRPQLLTDGNIQFSIGLSVDFRAVVVLNAASYRVVTGARWDVDLWDAGMWAAGLEIQQNWQTPQSYVGYCASLLLRVATNSIEVQWVATEFIYEKGGPLG